MRKKNKYKEKKTKFSSKKINDKKINKVKNRVLNKSLPIGQTLETQDKYLPNNKKTSNELKSSRPVIIADKQINPSGIEEYAIMVGSTQKTKNTFPYNKNGIKNIRNNIEVEDNESKPITLNSKFRLTNNSTRIPEKEIKKLYDNVVNHNRFSSENRKKKNKFDNRYKKSKN